MSGLHRSIGIFLLVIFTRLMNPVIYFCVLICYTGIGIPGAGILQYQEIQRRLR